MIDTIQSLPEWAPFLIMIAALPVGLVLAVLVARIHEGIAWCLPGIFLSAGVAVFLIYAAEHYTGGDGRRDDIGEPCLGCRGR